MSPTDLCLRIKMIHEAVEHVKGYDVVLRCDGKKWQATIGRYNAKGDTESEVLFSLTRNVQDSLERNIKSQEENSERMKEVIK